MIFKMTVRLYAEDNKIFGPGIAQLLHRVREFHSLRAAALSMNMAYSKAWTVLRAAEEHLGFKLLHTSTGGKGGGRPDNAMAGGHYTSRITEALATASGVLEGMLK